MSNLVTTQWLAENIDVANLVLLDASWHLPTAKRDAKAEFATAHIPGALFFDLDAHSDGASPLPHTLPTAEKFSADMQNLGVNTQSHVICYDTSGLFSAARCWWMFKIFGHENVSVLDGGLLKWLNENRAVENGTRGVTAGNFTANFNGNMVKSLGDVAKYNAQVVDARSPTRFRGEEPEPRPGVRPGHIPHSSNLHYAKLLNSNGTLKSNTELLQLFAAAGVDTQKPVITSCGSGVTAAILSLALTELAAPNHALYDGSWADWGSSGQAVELG